MLSRWSQSEGRQAGISFPQLGHRAFLKEFGERMFIGRKKATYKFIHLLTTHPPNVLNEACEFQGRVHGEGRPFYLIQDRCALEQVVEVLRRMKKVGYIR